MKEKKAAVDIGSNSLRLLIAERTSAGWHPVMEKIQITGLIRGISAEGYLLRENVSRSLNVLNEFKHEIRDQGAVLVGAVATSAVRDAVNGDEFVGQAVQALGGDIAVISGEEEAELSYLGVTGMLPAVDGECMVFDIGGGSLELIWDGGRRICSLPLGAVRMTERYIKSDPPNLNDMSVLRRDVNACLKQAGVPRRIKGFLAGAGGTAAALAMLDMELEIYSFQKVHGYTIHRLQVEYWLKRLCSLKYEQRTQLPGLCLRAAVMPAGVAVISVLMDWIIISEMKISAAGLLYGVITRF